MDLINFSHPQYLSRSFLLIVSIYFLFWNFHFERLVSLFGIFECIGLCYILSKHRSQINWNQIEWGLFLMFSFGIFVLKTSIGLYIFEKLNEGILSLMNCTQKGTNFLFGSFTTGKIEYPLNNFAFLVLPSIIFFSALMSILYYLGIMQKLVSFFDWLMRKTIKTSGAETLATSAGIFVGQTEAPLIIKPYLSEMTDSEIFAVMVGGFANTSVAILGAYSSILGQKYSQMAGHLIAQSVISAPAALICSKIVFCETQISKTANQKAEIKHEEIDTNLFDAATRGISEGTELALNVGKMLIGFIALTALLNEMIGLLGFSLEDIFGFFCWPFALMIGVPWKDCFLIGKLLGTKTVVNEMVGYVQLAEMVKQNLITERSLMLASWALAGFSNFSSIAIQVGGISLMAPEKRKNLAKLGFLAMITGSIATLMTASLAGVLLDGIN